MLQKPFPLYAWLASVFASNLPAGFCCNYFACMAFRFDRQKGYN